MQYSCTEGKARFSDERRSLGLKKKHYILMADIIGSSRHDGRGKKLMRQFKALVDTVNQRHRDQMLSPFTITLGDEFQGVPSSLASAVMALFDFEEFRIRQQATFQLRYVIYYGQIDTEINPDIAYEMVGPGLSGARKCLEGMKQRRKRFEIQLAPRDPEQLLGDALLVYFGMTDSWKLKDSEVLSMFLDGLTYKEIAPIVGRDRTSILRKSRTLRVEEYFASKRVIKRVLKVI